MIYNRGISSNMKVVCIDDEKTMHSVYANCLEAAACTVTCTADPGCLRDLVRESTVDVVFCKAALFIARYSAWQAGIRENPAMLHPSVVLVYRDKTEFLDAAGRFADMARFDYLVQPISRQELQVKLRAARSSRQLSEKIIASDHALRKSKRYIRHLKKELQKHQVRMTSDQGMLKNSLRQIALMVEDREGLQQELEKRSHTLEQNFTGLVDILAFAIDAKSPFHRGHTQKVVEISVYLAEKFDLPQKSVREIEIAARLHELGRLALTDKMARVIPETYPPEEKALYLSQAVEAAAMLERFEGFAGIAAVLRHLYENNDGTGIPDGLRKNEIPIGSRIIAGADLFDHLVYRKKGNSREDPFRQIERFAGSRLDTQVVHYLRDYACAHPVTELDTARPVKLFELKSGMQLAAGIYTRSGAKLLPMNTVLRKELISQIARYAKSEEINETVYIK